MQPENLIELPDGVIDLVLPHDELDAIEPFDWNGVGHGQAIVTAIELWALV